MTYELALVAVVFGAGYWGVFFLRRRPHGTATFGLMQLAAAGLAGLGLAGRSVDAPWLGVAGAIGVGAGACLLVLGPIARMIARRLVAAERIGLATRVLDLADVLAPGSGVAEEKALVQAMAEIRDGRIEPTVEALVAARERAPADARHAIDERIAMLYLSAYRWRDAIAHAEAHLLAAPPPIDAPGALRVALGVAPPVWVELLGAYGRAGDLERAAAMMARLEEVCADREDAAPWLHRARVMFLALCGQVAAVRALVGRARHMTRAARSYWIAVASEHAGDRAGAEAAYRAARARSRGRPRLLIDRALAELAPHRAELGPIATEVAARIAAAPAPRIRAPRRAPIRTAWVLAAVLLAVSAISALVLGPTSDSGTLVRAGAELPSLIAAGEWWRVISCVFVHAGTTHLLFNVAGLIVLGRFADDLFGPSRTIAVFGAAGLAGAAASYFASIADISTGASGAVFGLLGAVFVELTWHRQHYQAAWKRGVWGGLAVVTAAQLIYDFTNPVIDQWAHVGGLAAGAVVGLALSPNARWPRAGLYAARALAALFAVAVIVAGVQVARTSIADSLARGGLVRRVVGGVAITAPPSWLAVSERTAEAAEGDGHLVEGGIAELWLARQTAGAGGPDWLALFERSARARLGDLTAAAPTIALPDGWTGRELRGAPIDELGEAQPMRVVLCGRRFGDTTVVIALELPESIARAAPEFFARLLASSGPA